MLTPLNRKFCGTAFWGALCWQNGFQMPRDILVYADSLTATGSLMLSLQDSFHAPDYKIRRITAQDILNGVLRAADARIFILPGITGEVSPYTAQLPETALREIDDFVSRDHNVMMTLCAGSYFISRQTVYTPEHGAAKGRFSLLPLFNGVARGPVAGYGRKATDDCPFDDVIGVPGTFKTGQGAWEQGKICYGNGPALYPDDENDPHIEILARYADVAGEPAALLRQARGKGSIYLSCILPDIAHHHIAAERIHPSARRLMKDLKDNEPDRQKLWTSLTNRIKQDLK
jgi:glutamine amidotransferase-like uncharacterized protein